MPVARLENVGIAAGAAAEVVVAPAAEEDVARPRPVMGIGDVLRGAVEIDHRERHAVTVPDHAVGEDDVVDAGLQPRAVVKDRIQLAEELVDDPDEVGSGVVEEDQVLPVPHRPDLVRVDQYEPQLVDVTEVEIVDVVVAAVGADVVDVGLDVAGEFLRAGIVAADDRLVALGQDEEVGALVPAHDRVGRLVDDNLALLDAEGVRDGEDVEIHGHGFVGRQQHLEDEGLVDAELGVEYVVRVARAVVGIDLREDDVPAGEVVVDRVVGIARRRALEDRLEHRREFMVAGRAVLVGHDVVGQLAGELG